jgi:hypothetical protein
VLNAWLQLKSLQSEDGKKAAVLEGEGERNWHNFFIVYFLQLCVRDKDYDSYYKIMIRVTKL